MEYFLLGVLFALAATAVIFVLAATMVNRDRRKDRRAEEREAAEEYFRLHEMSDYIMKLMEEERDHE